MKRSKPVSGTERPRLSLVTTPIGNMEDITLRALRALKESDAICCEDTRNTKKLLDHYGIRPSKLIALYSQNEVEEARKVLAMAQEKKWAVSYCSDAGMPGISDPGALLLKVFRDADVPITLLPGPTASLSGLVLSGLDTADFAFYGFPPAKPGAKRNFFSALVHRQETLIFYESPHRIAETLSIVQSVFPPERKGAIDRELTKIHAETISGTLSELASITDLRGEIVLLIEGEKERTLDENELVQEIDGLLSAGLSAKSISQRLGEKYLLPKKEVYRRVLERKK